eukprot:5873815-Pleurochrysis_carterae.AAC.1
MLVVTIANRWGIGERSMYPIQLRFYVVICLPIYGRSLSDTTRLAVSLANLDKARVCSMLEKRRICAQMGLFASAEVLLLSILVFAVCVACDRRSANVKKCRGAANMSLAPFRQWCM